MRKKTEIKGELDEVIRFRLSSIEKKIFMEQCERLCLDASVLLRHFIKHQIQLFATMTPPQTAYIKDEKDLWEVMDEQRKTQPAKDKKERKQIDI